MDHLGAAGAAGHLAFDRHFSSHKVWRAGLLAVVLATAACTLAACGRAGAPELPPGPALAAAPPASPPAVPLSASPQVGPPPPGSAAAAQEAAQRNGFDAYGNPVAAPATRKSFFLDFLLQ